MHLVQSPKFDSYSFLHLVVALALRTLLLQPKWTEQVREASKQLYTHVLTCMPRIDWMTAGFDRFVAQDTPVGRYAAMIFYRLSAPYVVATLTIYIMDGLTQWSKRWSLLTPNCWALGVGVLGMRAVMGMLERAAENEL